MSATKSGFQLAVALTVAFGIGCAAKLWYRPGATEREFSRDKGECLAQSTTIAGGDALVGAVAYFDDCMFGRGWTKGAATANSRASSPAGAAKSEAERCHESADRIEQDGQAKYASDIRALCPPLP